MKLKTITRIEPKESVCIEVDAPDRLFAAGGADGKSIVSHNSVVQRTIIISTILRPNAWRFLGIDLKKVELSQFRKYSNVVLGIATTLEDAITVLRFAQETMMKRYAELEQLGLNNFLDLPEKGQALMVMVDEMGELLSPSGTKALSENTLIKTPTALIPLRDIEIGSEVVGLYNEPVEVSAKYEPVEQDRFDLKITRDSTANTETVVSGAEHFWVAYFENPDGTITGPETVTTDFLYSFKKEQESYPVEKRFKVKFKRASFDE